MDLTPAQYNRDITKRYDSGQDLDVYRTQQSYYAYGGLSVRQNLDLTGGTFYLESNLAYMRNFGDNSATQFTSVRYGSVIRRAWSGIILSNGTGRSNR